MPALLLLAASFAPRGATVEGDSFKYPLACATGDDGTIYVVDRRLPGVWRLKTGEDRPTIFKTGGRVFRTPLNAPRCVAVAAPSKAFTEGAVLVGDSATRAIYRLDPTTDEPTAEPLAPAGDVPGRLGVPSALAAGNDGTVFAADLESQRIYRIAPGGGPTPIAALPGVRGLCLVADGSLLAVTSENDAVRRLAPAEDGSWTVATAVTGRPFRNPQGAAFGPDRALYIADNAAACVWKLSSTADGRLTQPKKFAAGEPLVGPTGVCLDRSTDPPRLIVADPRAKTLFAIRLSDGAVTTLAE
ncbi:hypothetical protein [Alienimonas chondri]|nr:hypothetical protein [Alienimonas chondri]